MGTKADLLFDERKTEGNAFIQAQDYENAIKYVTLLPSYCSDCRCFRYYTEALKIPATKLEKDTRDIKRGAAFSNRSLAQLRFSSSQAPRLSAKFLMKALQDAQEAIKCRPMWSKAHFRMGESLRHLGLLKSYDQRW